MAIIPTKANGALVMSLKVCASPVSITMLCKLLEAASSHSPADAIRLAEFAGVGKSTAARALASLEALGLLVRDLDGRFVAPANGIGRGSNEEMLRNTIKRALIGYRPLEALLEGLALGEDLKTARRKASVLLGIPASDEQRWGVLVRWATELNILSEASGKIVLTISPTVEGVNEAEAISAVDVESEARARLFVATKLGRPVHDSLDKHERQLLSEAVLVYRSSPAISVEKSGQAVENYLRTICSLKGLVNDAAKLNGAGQLANLMVSKGLIHSHQQKLIETIATFRNAKAHHKDKKTLAPWEISESASFSALTLSLVVIRSIHEFIHNRKQIL